MSKEEYPLPEDDVEFLNADYEWEQTLEGSKKGLLIHNYTLPDGYTPRTSNLMILIPPDYPMGMIDMFYFCPAISRKYGGPISALVHESHFGQEWQRWSRHYDWRPGIDNIATHIIYVGNQLESESRIG